MLYLRLLLVASPLILGYDATASSNYVYKRYLIYLLTNLLILNRSLLGPSVSTVAISGLTVMFRRVRLYTGGEVWHLRLPGCLVSRNAGRTGTFDVKSEDVADRRADKIPAGCVDFGRGLPTPCVLLPSAYWSWTVGSRKDAMAAAAAEAADVWSNRLTGFRQLFQKQRCRSPFAPRPHGLGRPAYVGMRPARLDNTPANRRRRAQTEATSA